MRWRHRSRSVAGRYRAGAGRLTSRGKAAAKCARQTARWAGAETIRIRPRRRVDGDRLVELAGFAQIPQVLNQPQVQVRFGALGELAQHRRLANTLDNWEEHPVVPARHGL